MKTLILDCDGVVLNSNQIKTEAFRTAALPYGREAAEALVKHHILYGGISRYAKFEYFLSHIACKRPALGELDQLLATYAHETKTGLMRCEIAPGIYDLRADTADVRWILVSGSDQNELREIFSLRGLDTLFEGGVFGCPETKSIIFDRELESGNICLPAVYVGDTRHDYEVATQAGLDFVFAHAWTEFEGWKEFFEGKSVSVMEGLWAPSPLLKILSQEST